MEKKLKPSLQRQDTKSLMPLNLSEDLSADKDLPLWAKVRNKKVSTLKESTKEENYVKERLVDCKRTQSDPDGVCESPEGALLATNLGHVPSSVSTETWPLAGRKELSLPRTTHMRVEGSDNQVTEGFTGPHFWPNRGACLQKPEVRAPVLIQFQPQI